VDKICGVSEKFSHSGFKEGSEDMTDKEKEIGMGKSPL
jgi:hypothetical protein